MRIQDQVAIVTGGGSGLGAATARHLAGQGAKVAILDYDGARAEAVAAEIGGIAVQLDVGDEPAVGVAVAQVADQLGQAARIAVNCAGVGLAARIVGREGKMSFDVFERTLRVNLFGTYNVMSHAARLMSELEPTDTGERGVIVNTASVAAYDGQVGQVAYAASKGGIVGMTLPMARDLADKGVRVMTIAPGLFLTPLLEGLPQEVQDSLGTQVPFPSRLGDPSEYAALALHIVGNPMLNGEVIRLDGAIRMAPR